MGQLDYLLHPEFKEGFGGPFNGQAERQNIFRDILLACSFDSIVETGTFRGTTTEFMAKASGLPTFTVELNERIAAYASLRLRPLKNVTVFACDSRNALKVLFGRVSTPFCYLDAHWNKDVPLNDELLLIQKYWTNAITMIDDFKVEDDGDYSFDDYGVGRLLSLDYLLDQVKNDFEVFFPKTKGIEESGQRRGCVVLALRGSKHAQCLRQVASIRLHQRQEMESTGSRT
jgi:hypothetical protein